MRLRRIAALALVAGAGAAPLAVAQEQEAPKRGENVAVATTETDGAKVFTAKWELVRQRGGAIEQRNVANAAARCTDCRATAIAFQVVIVEGTPTTVKPFNQAAAITDQCTRCVVYAGARQFVRVVPGPVRFTEGGRATLQDVRKELRDLEQQPELTAAQLAAAVEAQEARVKTVLQEQLVAKDGKRARPSRTTDRQADDD